LIPSEGAILEIAQWNGYLKLRLVDNPMSIDEIKATLEKALPGAIVQVRDLTGGGDHFQVVVVSDSFAGKGLLDQHQMVYGPLRDAMGSEQIHALALKTFTPEQWERYGT
jgi:acid stress-induced BolA-like protein IbaG/YrbA